MVFVSGQLRGVLGLHRVVRLGGVEGGAGSVPPVAFCLQVSEAAATGNGGGDNGMVGQILTGVLDVNAR